MTYPCVITLLDGRNETLLSVRDFEYLIDHYMGMDALRYFRSIMEDMETERET